MGKVRNVTAQVEDLRKNSNRREDQHKNRRSDRDYTHDVYRREREIGCESEQYAVYRA